MKLFKIVLSSVTRMAASVASALNTSGTNTSSVSDSQGMTRSFSSSNGDHSGESSSQNEQLPNITVKEYLEKLAKELETRILARADEHGRKMMEEFEKQKAILVSEAKRMRSSAKTPLKIITIEISSPTTVPKMPTKKQTIKVGGDKSLVAKVGRSKGAQFLEGKGISLHWDKETSTWHGQFLMKDEQLWFEDLHSTNSTTIHYSGKSEPLEIGKDRPTQSAPVDKGDQLNIGVCRLKIISIENVDA